MGLAGAAITGVLGGYWPERAAAAEGPDADLVVFNARVYTVDSGMPKAEAFAVKGGRFSAVGSNSDIRALIAKGTETFDARQMAIVPGFIDCHNHAPGTSLLYDVAVGNPYVVEFVTISSIVEKLLAIEIAQAGDVVDPRRRELRGLVLGSYVRRRKPGAPRSGARERKLSPGYLRIL